MENHQRFMDEAYTEAYLGLLEGGIPIGSVLVKNNTIIGRGRNRRVQNDDSTAHAEIECIRKAGRIGSYKDCILYSTLMPCSMCAGAISLFKIPKVVVGESKNFSGSLDQMIKEGISVHILYDQECLDILASFIKLHPTLWDEDIGLCAV